MKRMRAFFAIYILFSIPILPLLSTIKIKWQSKPLSAEACFGLEPSTTSKASWGHTASKVGTREAARATWKLTGSLAQRS